MVATNEEAFQAMIQHHQLLVDGVRSRAFAIKTSQGSKDTSTVRIADLVNFLELEVIPHAKAEEHTIYQVAIEALDLDELVVSMKVEHEELASLLAQLKKLAESGATGIDDASRVANSISNLFAAHARSENEDILSNLVVLPHVDLVMVLKQMEQLFLAEKRSAAQPSSLPVDHEQKLVLVILDLARELAKSNGRDFACKRVANAWSLLKDDRPELAQSLNNALHALTSGGEVSETEDSGDSSPVELAQLDVRSMVPRDRHAAIFETYYELHLGDSFILINDHDPKPLKYQFEVEHSGEFTWNYLESGPTVWKVRIGKV